MQIYNILSNYSQCFSSSVSSENNNGLYTVGGSIALGNKITYNVEVASYSVAVNLIGLVEVWGWNYEENKK